MPRSLLVDGVLSAGGLAQVGPADIESMETAAGPAAAALFGAPAARTGVLRTTTRSGSAGARSGRCSAAGPLPGLPQEPTS